MNSTPSPIDVEGGNLPPPPPPGQPTMNAGDEKTQQSDSSSSRKYQVVIGLLVVSLVAVAVGLGVALANANSTTNSSPSSSSNDGSGKSCPSLASFSPNQMYDTPPSESCKTQSELDVWNVESAAFRLITAQSVRIYQNNRKWCFETWTRGGDPLEEGETYKFGNYAVHVISLLDTIEQLQMLPAECVARHQPLRDLLMPSRNASYVTFEYSTSTTVVEDDSPPLEWWEDEFLPTAAEAFSCGFSEEDQSQDPVVLPNDIRAAFPENVTVQQVWRLVKGFLRSSQKQRERPDRQQDFDVSLYVPFMPPRDVPLSRVYLGEENRPDGSNGANLRVGSPHYQGPAVWFLWHSFGARFFEMESSCNLVNSPDKTEKMLTTIKTMVAYFGLTHPCPYCRYHFTARVSRNDARWQDLAQENKVSYTDLDGEEKRTSESNLYPLEYLFVGGMNGPTLEDKLASVVDGKSLLLFFYKVHNAVTSSVTQSITCKTQELADDPAFACSKMGFEGSFSYDGASVSTRNLGRSWPTASRFGFWLKNGSQGFDESRQKMQMAHTKLNDLDNMYGIRTRQDFWTAGTNFTSEDISIAENILQATEELDEAMLKSNFLYTEYALETSPTCDGVLDNFEPLNVPLPLIDGNFPWMPQSCIRESQEEFSGRSLTERNLGLSRDFLPSDENCFL